MLKSIQRTLSNAFKLVMLGALLFNSVSLHAQVTKPAKACEATPEVQAHTTLSGLANFWFGSPDFQFAILTATNARSSDPKFAYISNPNHLPTGAKDGAGKPNHVCIPEIAEAERLKLSFDSYLAAVNDMALAEPSEVVNNLDPVPTSGPVSVVSWVRADQAKGFPDKPGQDYLNQGYMWVTLAPHVQEFCREFTSSQSDNPDRLTLRLEQRLGLAPASSKTHFVELSIATPNDGKSLFRPCGDSNVTTTSCALGGPSTCNINDKTCHQQSDFFYHQYYSSYGSARPVEYPWTSLGYTFDWEYKQAGLGGRFDFVQIGESEYVVPPNTKMKLVSKQTTAEYCGLVK